MQVNSVQNNNTSFQALKINSKLKSELEKLSLQKIKAIKKLGEDVKGVRHYDICFEDNIVTPKIRRTKSSDKKDYLQEFRDEEKLLGKHCKVELKYLTYERLLPDEPKLFRDLYGIQASQKYAEFKKQDEFKQIANLAKFLEKDEINKRNEVKTANIKHATKHSKVAAKALELKFAVEELMHNHQYKAPNKLLSWLFD